MIEFHNSKMGRQPSPEMKDACVQTFLPRRGASQWKKLASVIPSTHSYKAQPKEDNVVTVCLQIGEKVQVKLRESLTVKVQNQAQN